jgi:hypothetical protein
MIRANLELSQKEYETIISSEFILTKNRIIEKVYELFGSLSEMYKSMLNDYGLNLPGEIFSVAPKIYKGEQYLNLPYVMMDFPRMFSKPDVFAIRSFFWWGNYFSITLHLSGKYIFMFAEALILNKAVLENEEWFLGINEDEWQHHFQQNNYISFKEIKSDDMINLKSKKFIKIAKKLNLENWQFAEEFYASNYKKLLELICTKQSIS